MKFYQSKATSTQSQSFLYAIFFFPRLKKYLRTYTRNMKPTQNNVVYMPEPLCGAVILCCKTLHAV